MQFLRMEGFSIYRETMLEELGQNQLTWVDKNGRVEIEATDRAFRYELVSK